MSTQKMHESEVDIDASLVRRLLAEQFPRWADVPIRAVRSTADGERHLPARRPPLRATAARRGVGARSGQGVALVPEARSALSLRIPKPVGMGHPAGSHPFCWAIYGWIEGQPYADDLVDDERQAAKDLAQFVVELRRIDPVGAPRGGRNPLRELDAVTRAAIESARGIIDGDAATAVAWWSAHSKRRRGKEDRSACTPIC